MASSVSRAWRRSAAVPLAAALTLVLLPPSATAAPDGGGPGDAGTGACIAVRPEARYVPYGWTHVVVLASSCASDATCTVATDVTPEKQTVTVPRGATVEVVTFVASPSQAFRPHVECRLR